jgi:hypothetical protein
MSAPFKQRYQFFPLIQTSLGFVELIEQRIYGEPIPFLPSSLLPLFQLRFHVKIVTQPDIGAVFLKTILTVK